MPHDWINVHVDGDADARTVVKQCARCRLLAVVHESGTRAAIDYHPQHIRAPQDCPRGDMTEERASETAALRADLAAAIARAEAAEKERESLMARIEEVSGVTAAECPLSVEAALAALDKLDRMRPVVDAALLWHRGETQAEESRNDDGLRAAVAAYLDGDHAKGGG